MKYSFRASIYKVGINACVNVPLRITAALIAAKGYIPVKGSINAHPFRQTLVPVKNAEYRLYVNGPMLKGSGSKVGDTVLFSISQASPKKSTDLPMPRAFKKALTENRLSDEFKKLIPSRQKEILKYLNYLKTEEALVRNIEKVISQLMK